MNQNFKTHIITLLLKDNRLKDEQGELKGNVLKEFVNNLDEKVITLLLNDTQTRSKFFLKIKDAYVFKTNEFKFFLDENSIDNSYTQYSNQIGLASGGKFLKNNTDVVLNFPFKDCILEGGQSTEDGLDTYFEYDEEQEDYIEKQSKRKEIFFNEVLAKDEIDRLIEPKAFTNITKYDSKGESKPTKFNRNAKGTITDNLIIKGNNLLALNSLKQEFKGKVKLIYIDPPYNTGNDSFAYNDNFNHSTWLTFMRNRIEVAKDLLREDGVIFIQCDDKEQAYLRVLMDSVFKPVNFINVITIKTKIGGVSGSSEGKSLKDSTEFITSFCKNKELINFNPVYIDTPLVNYIKNYKISGKSWKYNSVIVKMNGKTSFIKNKNYELFYYEDFETTSVKAFAKEKGLNEYDVYEKYSSKIIRTTNAQSSVRKRMISEMSKFNDQLVSIEYKPIKGKNKDVLTEVYYIGEQKNMLMFLNDNLSFKKDKPIYREKLTTLWNDIQYNNLKKEGIVDFPNGKKPEKLIERIIELSTSEKDIVLDYHLGSGTTGAVAHKMNRQYIGLEQIDNQMELSKKRLNNVINNDQSGISKTVNWKGGGSFVYLELAKNNQTAKEEILKCNSLKELLQYFETMYTQYFLHYNVRIKQFKETISKEENFKNLALDRQKEIFSKMLDLNQLYVNQSEIEDSRYQLDAKDIALSKDFYQINK